jgi:Ca2+-binding RTX toxin-like protein
LIGGIGVDHLYAAGTGWNILAGGPGDDFIVGGSGSADQFDQRWATTDMTVTLGTPGLSTGGEDVGSDRLENIEWVVTGSGNDTLYGDAGNNTLIGGDGDDRIYGLEGDDLLVGRQGDDTLDGGTGMDWFQETLATSNLSVILGPIGSSSGGEDVGSDVLISVENVLTGSGDDSIIGDNSVNVLIGGPGTDRISGGEGDDKLCQGVFTSNECSSDPDGYVDFLNGESGNNECWGSLEDKDVTSSCIVVN